MAKIKIEGLPGWDGEYDFDGSYFTNRELQLIKRETGIRAGELEDAMLVQDNDLVVAVTLIALKRLGKEIPAEMLWDAPVGKITMELDEGEADAGPPAVPPSGPEPSDSSGNAAPISGSGSSPTGDQPVSPPSRTGTLGLVTGATSGSETLAS